MSPPHHAIALALLTAALPATYASSQPAAKQALLPTVHWDHDTTDLQHLLPVDNHRLYYSDSGIADPTIEHAFAHITTNISHPAVILGHSSYIKSVQCTSQQAVNATSSPTGGKTNLQITFTDNAGYDFAKKAWVNETDFILTTYTEGCGTLSDQRTFWLIDHLTSGNCDLCITAVVKQEVATGDALHDVDLAWGTYTPAHTSKRARRGLNRHKRQVVANSSSSDACGAPPSDKIDGFPTASCNSNTFDLDLDNKIGYLSFDDSQYSDSLEGYAPGLGDFAAADNQGFGPTPGNSTGLSRRHAPVKRGFLGSFAATLTKALVRNGLDPFGPIINIAKTINEKVIKPIVALTSDQGASFQVPLTYSPDAKDLTMSPWGTALEIYKYPDPKPGAAPAKTPAAAKAAAPATKVATPATRGKKVTRAAEGSITVYCVQCGTTGQVNLNGKINWSPGKKLQDASLSVSGNIGASLQLGVAAQIEGGKQFRKSIVVQGIPGFSVTNVFSIGPTVYLDALVDLSVKVEGNVLLGANISIPNFAADVNFATGNGAVKKFDPPKIDKFFQAETKITASAGLGLPIGLAIGLDIPAISYRKALTLSEKPALAIEATYSASTQCTAGCQNGIDYSLNFVNSIDVDVFGLTGYNLNKYEAVLKKDCLGLNPRPKCPASKTGSEPGSKRSLIDHHNAEYAPHLMKKRQDFNTTTSNTTTSSTNATQFFTNMTNFILGPVANSSFYQSDETTTMDNLEDNTSVVPYANDTDLEFMTITTLHGNTMVLADDNDNIVYSQGNGTDFASISGFVQGDGARFFHYYPDTMAAYNVSRLRVSDELDVPATAKIIALAPVNYNDNNQTSDVFVAQDTLGKPYFPVTCDIRGQPSKAFLVADLTNYQKLLDPILRYTVTGGVVQQCYYLPWAAPAGSDNAVVPANAGNATMSGMNSTSTR